MNRNISRVFFLTTLLIFILGITCASAADTTDDVVLSDTDAPGVDTDDVTESAQTQIVKKENTNTKTGQEVVVTQSTYSDYFDEDNIAKKDTIASNSEVTLSGDFKNTDFIFDDIEVTLKADANSTLYNASIITQNNAKLVIDGIKIDNTNYESAIVLDSKQNTVQNVQIKQTNKNPVHVIEVMGDNNKITDTTVTATAPSADVNYDANNVGRPQTSGIYISSSNNIVENSVVNFDGSELTGYYPSVDGIDIQSPGANTVITNNTISNTQINVKGTKFVYGINVGRAKNTNIDNIDVNVDAVHYADAIQLFDADTITITGTANAAAENISYGVYGTAMAIGTSKNIFIEDLLVTSTSLDATAILIEGSSNIKILNNTHKVNGPSATAVNSHVDWYGNVPVGYVIADNTIIINTTGNSNALYFGLCENVIIENNTIVSDKGAPINFNSTTKSQVTNNYITINDKYGDNAVTTTEKDSIIKDNNAAILLTDDTYSQYFNNDSTLKTSVNDGSKILASGVFNNRDFIFSNKTVTFTGDESAKLLNSSIIAVNNAKVTVDAVNIENIEKQAVLFDSQNNTLSNSQIKVTSSTSLRTVELSEDNNRIINTTVDAQIPSADIPYDSSFVGHPVSAGIYVSSNNNRIENVKVNVNGEENEKGSYYPSIDAVDLQSKASGILAENNTVTNTTVTVTGKSYVYGINVGRQRNALVENVDITALSDNYADAIQLFDADTVTITGKILSQANDTAYGVYSTAMAVGTTNDINIKQTNIHTEAPYATAVLLEGVGEAKIENSEYEITGQNAKAVTIESDWMGNVPSNVEITGLKININTTGSANTIELLSCDNITVKDNKIINNKGSEIIVNNTNNTKITDNIIIINDTLYGNDGVITTQNDTVIENNTPTQPLSDYIKDLLDRIDNLTAQKDTLITLTQIPETKLGETINITGQLTDTKGYAIPGTIKLLINNGRATVKTNVEGVFTYNYKTTKIGTLNITATYQENTKYNEATAATSVNVVQQDTKIVINDIEDIKTGNNVTITGTLTDINDNPLAGSIKLTINNGRATVKTDNTGVFTYTTALTAIGENNITAAYLESAKYHETSTTATVTVTAKETQIKLDTLKPTQLADNITISGTLLDEDANAIAGTVKLLINNGRATVKTDNNGVFIYTYKTTKIGVNNLTVSYLGTSKYQQTSTQTTFEVTQSVTRITFDPTGTVVKGNNVTITGKLTDANDNKVAGTIKLLINNGRATVKTDSEGVFTYIFTANNVGTNNITATYLESAKYTGSTQTTQVEVKKLNTKIALDTISSTVKGNNVTITGKLTDANDNKVTGTIKLLINNGRATVKTDANGAFEYTYTTTRVGLNNVTATYLESNSYEQTTATSAFTVLKA